MSVDSVAGRPTRRERQRRQTLAEIKTRAVDQVAAGGAESVSLNAIARAMGMSPAALYRYFASRDALLAELVADAYGSLADALTVAASGGGGAHGALVAVAHAYRDWALANPNSYLLIFQTRSGSGLELEPERVVAAAQRSMDVILSALGGAAGAELGPELAAQVEAWGQRSQVPGLAAGQRYLGLLAWTRLHGLISLELGQHLTATGVDPALLYEAEVQSLLRTARLSSGQPA
ncbi:MAG TPA: TetR/AcrR family transcriptional regulator [Streptosporangiaceae bacterium]|jgi:AcrR family transcriptional regulator